MSGCPICSAHRSEKISGFLFRSGPFLVRHSEFSKKLPGYLYVEPVSHREAYSEWTSEEFAELGTAFQRATTWIYDRFSPQKIYTVLVAEKVAHMHFHLIPRFGEIKGPEYIRLALEGLLDLPETISFPEI
ncbi:HIT family protein [Leptospira inadai]|uniref:HIT family protein n=1 Tax=Leptospira inadai TaxID=29506 RepID=UPI00058718C5|nr:hydrolase [Leptospira inadai]